MNHENCMARARLRCFLFCVPLLFAASSSGQVIQTRTLASAVRQARRLLAGATASDLPHHVHYDVKFRDRYGHKATATFDIYRDPLRFIRVDVTSGGYHSESVEDLIGKHNWRHVTGEVPLKLFDLDDILLAPQPALFGLDRGGLNHSGRGSIPVHQEMVNRSPYLCADDHEAIRVCFDPLIRAFVFAQVFNETFVYSDWMRIGTHAIPAKIQIFDDSKVLVEATGSVEPVKKFPPSFFQPAPQQGSDQKPLPKVVHMQAVPASPFYGNVEIQITIDPAGKVTDAKILDSDDKRINRPALKFARGLAFAPPDAGANNAPPLTTLFYLHYFPQD